MRGQPNVTIVCLHEFHFVFRNVSTVKINNIHIQNCSCFNGYGLHHHILENSITRVEIVNSRFTSSCLTFQHYQKFPSIIEIIAVIKDTTFEKSSGRCKSILDLSLGDRQSTIN